MAKSDTSRRGLKPYISRVKNDVRLVAPPGCYASVLLKLVDREDGRRYYSWWAMAGRHDADNVCVPYKYTGEDTIRFDLPLGMPLSESRIQSHLAKFLKDERSSADEPPIIIRD